jgi:hypothetical protein
MRDNLPFLFKDPDEFGRQTFALHIPKGIRSKDDLLLSYKQVGRFPDYFGKNWDAFEELLRDFYWIEQPEIFIIHEDLPLRGNKDELRTYLEILRSVVSKNAARLRVYFPSDVRDELIRTLNEN